MDAIKLHTILNFDTAKRHTGQPVLNIFERMAIHKAIANNDFTFTDKFQKKLNGIHKIIKKAGYKELKFQVNNGQEFFIDPTGKTNDINKIKDYV